MFRAAATAFAVSIFTCIPRHPAAAEAGPPPCAPYAEMTETLRQRYGESLRFRAEENRGFALELFAHADGSWTLVMRREDQACAIAAGTRWREQPPDESAF